MFVPGDRPERFAKALGSGADITILDLEDAVAVDSKEAARAAVEAFLCTGAEVVVRINGSDTDWFADDLAVLAPHSCSVMVPKAHSVDQLTDVAEALPSGTPLIALIETARGLVDAVAVCEHDAVVRAAFGSVDLGAELGVDPDDNLALQFARSSVVVASAAAGCSPPLDGVTTDLATPEGLARDLAHAEQLGFGGKLCIHPKQVPAANDQFSPSKRDVEWARRIVSVASEGRVCVVDGKMVDKPVIDRAQRILARHTR